MTTHGDNPMVIETRALTYTLSFVFAALRRRAMNPPWKSRGQPQSTVVFRGNWTLAGQRASVLSESELVSLQARKSLSERKYWRFRVTNIRTENGKPLQTLVFLLDFPSAPHIHLRWDNESVNTTKRIKEEVETYLIHYFGKPTRNIFWQIVLLDVKLEG